MAKAPAKAKTGKQLTRAGGVVDANSPGSAGQAVSNANKWREQYNYLRGLMMSRAVQLLEAGLNGDYCELQRVFALAESSNGTYVGLVERCLAPFADFEWQIKTVPEEKLPPGTTAAQAEAQAVSLRNAYDAVDNLNEAIEHLAMADFRGFAHVQKQRANGSAGEDVLHLECLPTWKFSRDGMFGDWFWNPEMRPTAMNAPAALGEANRISPTSQTLPRNDFIIREVRTPIDRVGLQFFIYTKLAEKNYAGFMEIYGIPSGVVTMPANVPKEQLDEYELTARRVAEGGSGAIPNGATYTANDSPRASDPFGPFLKYWQEQLILAGTSGKLTMLAESGSGTLAGGSHKDTFGQVAAMRAKKVSENFQRDFDAEVLQRYHPDEPKLAYFEICAKDETDVTQFVAAVLALKNAGKNVDTDFIAEKTGYQFGEDDVASPSPGGEGRDEGGQLQNRYLFNKDGFVTIDGHVVFVGPDKDETDGGERGAGQTLTSHDLLPGDKVKVRGQMWTNEQHTGMVVKVGKRDIHIQSGFDQHESMRTGYERRVANGTLSRAAADKQFAEFKQNNPQFGTYKYSHDRISEVTRGGVTYKADHWKDDTGKMYRIRNRSQSAPSAKSAEVSPELSAQFKAAVAEDLRPYLARLAERLPAITAIADPDLRQQKLDAAFAELDATIGADILQDPASARVLEHLTTAALADGLRGEKLTNRYLFNGDLPGHEFHGNQYVEAPGRISAEEADRQLTEGFEEKDKNGRPVKFGTRYKQHTEDHPNPVDVKDRKERLPWARETVKSGERIEKTDPKTGKPHAYYAKHFADGNKAKGFVSLVDVQDGEAFSGFRAPRNYISKLGIKNRRGRDESGEQPPLTIWQTIAAAGGLPDWFKFNPPQKIVNP